VRNKIDELIEHWREVGPVAWAEDPHGWVSIDKEPIMLEPWQRTILLA